MKAIKLVFTVLFFSLAVSASAQFTNATNSSVGSVTSASTANYNRFYGSFVIGSPTIDYAGVINYNIPSAYGASVGFLWGINLVQGMPLFLEVGPELSWMRATDEITDGKTGSSWEWEETSNISANYVSISAPVNVTYHFSLNDGKVILAPLLGLNAKVNLIASGEEEYTYKEFYKGELEEHESSTNKIDAFDKKDTDGNTANRFQFGYNIGANVTFGSLTLGYRYQGDFTDFVDAHIASGKINTNYISIGYTF